MSYRKIVPHPLFPIEMNFGKEFSVVIRRSIVKGEQLIYI